MNANHKMTPERIFQEWVKDKGPDYCQGFLDGISQFSTFLTDLRKNSVSNDTE